MSYLGDYTEDYADLNFPFTSRQFSSGAPFTLAGTPSLRVYKSNDIAQSTAGITLSVDFDGLTGLNNVKIDLSSDAFYVVGEDYKVVIQAGTVDGVSVVGEVVASFSIENRFAEVDVTKLGGVEQSATDLKDFADAGYDPATNKVEGVKTVDVNTDTAASLITADTKLDRNADLTESQSEGHTWQGNWYYVDPVNGATHASGNRGGRADPYLTIQDCHDNAVTDSNHDIIFLVAGAAAGVTTHTVAATTTISKRYTFIRGPGRDFIITRTGAGDTLAITADGIEISGVQIGTAATGSGDGIDITGADYHRVHDCWFLNTQGDGIHVLRGSNCRFHDNHFEGTGVGGSGQGIHIVGTGGSSNDNVIRNNHFANTAGDAILIEQGTTNDTEIHHNMIHDSSGWGINIGASSTDAQVHNNILGNNSSGNIQDNGTTTILANNKGWLSPTVEERTINVDVNGRVDLAATQTDVTFASMTCTGAFTISDGVIITASTGGRAGVSIVGDGSASGFRVEGGATGHGFLALGGVTSGNGFHGQAQTLGEGMHLAAGGDANGLECTGGGTGSGLLVTGGATGHGIKAVAGFTSGNDIEGDLSGSVGSVTARVESDVVYIHGSALTETTPGYLAAAFVKLFDVATPLLVASTVMRGTDSANTTAPPTVGAIADAVWDELQTGHVIAGSFGLFLDAKVSNAVGAMFNILPISSVASDDGSQNATSLVGYQYSALGPLVITVTDVDGNAVDLSGDSLKFIVWNESDPSIIIFTIPGDGGSITVSGAGNNIATIAAPSTLMTTAYRSLRWKLFDTTEKIQRAWGYLTIQIMGDEPA